MITYETALDMVPGGNSGDTGSKVTLYLNQDDEDFILKFNLLARTGTLTIENGTTASIQGTKNDNTTFEGSATLDVESKTVTVQGSRDMTNVDGKGQFELCLTHASKKLHSANFTIQVEKKPVPKTSGA